MSTGIDIALLRACKHKSEWDKLRGYIFEAALDEHTKVLLVCFKKFYEAYPDTELIDMDTFKFMFFQRWYPNLSQDAVNTYNSLFPHIVPDLPYEQQVGLVNTLIEQELCTLAANDIDDYSNGEEIDVITVLEKRIEVAKDKVKIIANTDFGTIESLADKLESSCQYQWPLPCLMNKMRPLEGGDQVILAALSDVGKTSFTGFLVCFFSLQTNKPWLWLNNEGSKERIQKRLYGMLLASESEQIDAYIKDGTLRQRLLQRCGRDIDDVIRVFDVHGKSNKQIEELLKNTHESTGIGGVVWDMLDNVKYISANHLSRRDEVLEEMYQWSRELGVKYDYPTFATSQQSANTEWQKFPDKMELKGSKVGKQGASDVIMFLTQETEASRDTYRYLSTPKNKLAIPTAPSVQDELRWNKRFGVPYQEDVHI